MRLLIAVMILCLSSCVHYRYVLRQCGLHSDLRSCIGDAKIEHIDTSYTDQGGVVVYILTKERVEK